MSPLCGILDGEVLVGIEWLEGRGKNGKWKGEKVAKKLLETVAHVRRANKIDLFNLLPWFDLV